MVHYISWGKGFGTEWNGADETMTIIQIQCFCAVAKYGSFSRAAEALFISQSSVSKHLSAFEEECGFPLLFRGSKHFDLTPEGQRMLRECNWLLTIYEQLLNIRENLRKKPDLANASFSLVGNPEMANYGVIMSINRFTQLHPEITVHLQETEDAYCGLALINNECDIAFASDIGLDGLLYNWQDYCAESLSVVMPLNSPLAGKERICMRDLKDFPLITAPQKTSLYDFCLNGCKSFGFEPHIALQASRPSIALGCMESHPRMVYLSPARPLEHLDLEKFRVAQIADSPVFHYVIAWKRDRVLPEKVRQYLKFISAPAPEDFIEEYQRGSRPAVD